MGVGGGVFEQSALRHPAGAWLVSGCPLCEEMCAYLWFLRFFSTRPTRTYPVVTTRAAVHLRKQALARLSKPRNQLCYSSFLS